MGSSIITLLRLAVLGVATAFAVIVLAMGAHIIFVISTTGLVYDFTALGVAVGALTIITLVPLLAISLVRKGALPNFIVVESAWFGILWVLWLAAAGLAADQTRLLPASCSFDFIVNGNFFSCHEPLALEAFAWLNWLLLFGYWSVILTLSIIQQTRGNSVWTKSVNEVDFFAPRVAGVPGVMGEYPVQPQQVYAPQTIQQQPVQLGYPPATSPTYVTTPPAQQGSPAGYPQV